MGWGRAQGGAAALSFLVVAIGGGCLEAEVSVCADGRVCPGGSICYDATSECLLPEQRSSCADEQDGASCSFPSTPDGLCLSGVCRARGCGDGVVSSTEDCDGENLNGATCLTLEYTEPAGLKCDANCRFDPTDCIGYCGDGIRNGDEPCDGDDIGTATCQTLGYYDAPGLTCSRVSCTFDVSACTGFCQDGILEPDEGEVCDMAPPPGETCLDYGFDRGRLGCSEFCSPGFDGCGFIGWRPTRVTNEQITGLWGSGVSDVFATTLSGTILHFDGVSWSETSVTPGVGLKAIHGVGGAVFAVGQSGTALRLEGGVWQPMVSGTSVDLTGVWARSPSDVYAVGSNGVVLQFDGATWSQMTSNTNFALHAVSGDADSVVAVGAFGTILRHDGAQWSSTTIAGGTVDFAAVFASSGSDVWAVGFGVAAHFDGAEWTQHAIGGHPTAVWSDGAGMWFASGALGGMWVLDRGRWVPMDSGTSLSVDSLWGTSATDVLAAAGPNLLHYDGAGGYRPVEEISGVDTIVGMWGDSPESLVVAALDQNIYRYDGSEWAAQDTGYPLVFSVWAASEDDLFASVIVDGIVHWDGNGWTKMDLPTTERIRRLWGVSSVDVFAVGNAGTILRYDGGSWTAMSSGTSEMLNSVWGTSATDVWVAGNQGSVLHYDGVSWSGTSLGSTPIYDLWGSSSQDVYAVGEGGIWRFDGTSWQAVDLGLELSLTYVAGTARDDVFFAGGEGMVLHFDGVDFTPIRVGQTLPTGPLYVSESVVVVAAGRGEVHRLQRTSAW